MDGIPAIANVTVKRQAAPTDLSAGPTSITTDFETPSFCRMAEDHKELGCTETPLAQNSDSWLQVLLT
jgi:hypothetical protein